VSPGQISESNHTQDDDGSHNFWTGRYISTVSKTNEYQRSPGFIALGRYINNQEAVSNRQKFGMESDLW